MQLFNLTTLIITFTDEEEIEEIDLGKTCLLIKLYISAPRFAPRFASCFSVFCGSKHLKFALNVTKLNIEFTDETENKEKDLGKNGESKAARKASKVSSINKQGGREATASATKGERGSAKAKSAGPTSPGTTIPKDAPILQQPLRLV